MNEQQRIYRRLTIGYVMAALSLGLLAAGTFAIVLHPFFHGHLEYPSNASSFWVVYFTIGSIQVDCHRMFAVFAFAFVVLPVVLGVWLASCTTERRFQTAGPFFGFGFLLALGFAFNAYVVLMYLCTNWNSSDPF